MQTVRPMIAGVFLLVVALAACQMVEPPLPQGPLVQVQRLGGECPKGACESRIVIERDGRIHQVKPQPAELGRMGVDQLTALEAAVRTTDFAVLRSRPFTGECPTAFDGQEVIYVFAAPGGEQRIASCEVEIDPSHPLFNIVESQLNPGIEGGEGAVPTY